MARKELNAASMTIEQADELMMPAQGDLGDFGKDAATALNTSEIEPTNDLAGLDQKAELLKFFEEKVLVQIMDSQDPNPEPFVFLSVNGKGPMPGVLSQWVPRNQPILMARKYVEVLARAKPVSHRTVDAVDSDGYKTTVIKSTSSLRYPFTVLQDNNPRGGAWLRELMRQR